MSAMEICETLTFEAIPESPDALVVGSSRGIFKLMMPLIASVFAVVATAAAR